MELSGLDLAGFFDSHVRGYELAPLDKLLPEFGIKLCTRPANKNLDLGGKASKNVKKDRNRSDLGVRFGKAEGGVKLVHVYPGGAAHQAGLSAKDVVVAVDGLKVGYGTIYQSIGAYPIDSEVVVHAFREDVLHEFTVKLQAPPENIFYLEWMKTVAPAVELRRKEWLKTI